MASLEPEPAGDEPEPQPDDGSVPERAPIAAPRGDGPDMMQQLQMQQLERMQLAVEFLTTPACRSAPKDKKVDYLKKQLKISDKEVEQAFGKAQDQLLQPAIDFLSNEQVRAQPIAKRVSYLQTKLGLNDKDVSEAFERIGDAEAVPFFKARRITMAVQFRASASSPLPAVSSSLQQRAPKLTAARAAGSRQPRAEEPAGRLQDQILEVAARPLGRGGQAGVSEGGADRAVHVAEESGGGRSSGSAGEDRREVRDGGVLREGGAGAQHGRLLQAAARAHATRCQARHACRRREEAGHSSRGRCQSGHHDAEREMSSRLVWCHPNRSRVPTNPALHHALPRAAKSRLECRLPTLHQRRMRIT